MMNEINSFPESLPEAISAKAKGYSFRLYDQIWILDKNSRVNLSVIHQHLSGDALQGCLKTLAFYGANRSGSFTKNVVERIQHMLRQTGAETIKQETLINYRASLSPATEWYLGVIRGALRRWHRLGYFGISKDLIRLIDGWRIKGNRKGDAVRRQDPTMGPLTDIELQAFNEGAVRAYEQSFISLAELAIALCSSHTGRRPIQLSHLRIQDLSRGQNNKGEPFYILNVPRGKHGEGFRSSFKPFAMTEELWTILTAQAEDAALKVEERLGFKLQDVDRQQIPVFPDLDAFEAIRSPAELQRQLISDHLHIASAAITDVIQDITEVAEIYSERTGDILWLNARRFRYTTGTRAAREGFGELVIAELLDHMDTQNAGVYVKNIPEHVQRLDEAIGFQLAPYAQAFTGVLVDSERDAVRGDDTRSRIRTGEGVGIGTCGEHGFCGAAVPIPCYTCMHYQPWLNGPHEQVYQYLLSERERVMEVTGDIEVAAVLDRSIVGVADVIARCNKRREELSQQESTSNG